MMTLPFPTSQDDEWKVIKAKTFICRDPDHCHKSPLQKMLMVEINNHIVEITQDDDVYSIRIDDDQRLTRYDLTPAQILNFISENT